ncbi:MAG TPA: glycine--tRNA ligase [Candidatus Omnitrophota bacterium]|nr:glycine--tRNA ligase [Candidatus Omnitrophota bacterium]
MAFIVKKKIHGNDYFYLNENKRVDGKVKTTTIAYLGKDRKEAEKKMKEMIDKKIPEENVNKNPNRGSSPPINIKKEAMPESPHNYSVKISIEELAAFCKRKGFIYPSGEIYGGLAGFWDFGPLGVELLNNIKKEWWDYFVKGKENIVGIEASVISPPKTWKASGHTSNFTDVSVQCMKCKKFNKVDKVELEHAVCSFCGGKLDKSTAKDLNLMFKTNVGPVEDDSIPAYLRPETAQGMFLDFKLVQQTARMQLPFGIAQIGRCFRNEIAPRDFLFRSREFHIGEFEFFVNPEEKKCDLLEEKHLNLKFKFLSAEFQIHAKNELKDMTIRELLKEGKLEEWHAYWLAEQILWFHSIGLIEIKIREHMKDELSHYSSATFDIDYEYPFGSKEIAGIANRGQFDLTNHERESKQSMLIFDEKYKNKVIPKVIEPTFGIERVFLAILAKAYHYDKEKDYTLLKIPAKLAPVKAAIFPIVKQPEYEKLTEKIYSELKKEFNVIYDISGSIGRRYARNDEIGTPYCITIDEDSLKNKDVTIRVRDTTQQIRVKIDALNEILRRGINGEDISKLGKKVDTRKK